MQSCDVIADLHRNLADDPAPRRLGRLCPIDLLRALDYHCLVAPLLLLHTNMHFAAHQPAIQRQ